MPENLRRPKVCRDISSGGCPATAAVKKKPSLRRDRKSLKLVWGQSFKVKVSESDSDLVSHPVSHKIRVKTASS